MHEHFVIMKCNGKRKSNIYFRSLSLSLPLVSSLESIWMHLTMLDAHQFKSESNSERVKKKKKFELSNKTNIFTKWDLIFWIHRLQSYRERHSYRFNFILYAVFDMVDTYLTANGTFCSPIALNNAEKWIIQSIRWSTTILWRPCK